MDFPQFLNEKLKEKGLTLKKLSDLSGIALKHLENLMTGNLNDLPAAPYVRGYLAKLGEVLDFDSDTWWQRLAAQKEISSSGSADRLPDNRFLKKSSSKKIWLIVIIIIALFYFGIRLPEIIGRPTLTITFPPENLATLNSKELMITGHIKNGNKVLVNGEEILINAEGDWQKIIPLDPGLNNIEITGKKFLGREVKIIREIIYEEPKENLEESNATSTKQSVE